MVMFLILGTTKNPKETRNLSKKNPWRFEGPDFFFRQKIEMDPNKA